MRRILVAGANKGIGRAIAERILEEHDDTFVLLGARSRTRGEATVEALLKERFENEGRVELLEIDVVSDRSVERAARVVAERFGSAPAPLYALVNNAGIGRGSGGLAEILDVNVRGIRRVTEAFLPLLDTEVGRIVNVTSAAGPSFVAKSSEERKRQLTTPSLGVGGIEALIEEALRVEREGGELEAHGLGSGDAYGLSKALANTYTLVLAERHPRLAINACTPGFIATDMTRPYAEADGRSPGALGMKTPREGARSALFLLFGELEGNGRYYGSDGQRSPLDRYRSPGDPPYRGD